MGKNCGCKPEKYYYCYYIEPVYKEEKEYDKCGREHHGYKEYDEYRESHGCKQYDDREYDRPREYHGCKEKEETYAKYYLCKEYKEYKDDDREYDKCRKYDDREYDRCRKHDDRCGKYSR